MKKKHFLLFLILLPFTFSCKKFVEEKKRDLLIESIIDGSWIVTRYLDVANDVTNEFTGYQFSFTEDGKVISDFNTVKTVGTWEGNISEYSITSTFPVTANPLGRLNGKWIVKESDFNFVRATRMVNSEILTLELTKKM